MTRTCTCDVCGAQTDMINAEEFFVVQIPASHLDASTEEPLMVDLCSPECLLKVAQGFDPAGPKPQESVPGEPNRGRLRPQQEFEAYDPGASADRYEGQVTVR